MAVAHVLGKRFRTESFSRAGVRLSLMVASALAVATVAYAQTIPARNSAPKSRTPVSVSGPQTPTPPATSDSSGNTAAALTAQQLAPQPPVVNWDGSLLTIDADNSTLMDVLIAVRSRTGATMEIPPAASNERVFVHLGPGPIREIVSSLLYGTGFDYVAEAADDDPNALRSLVVIVQGMGDESSAPSVAGSSGIIAAGTEGNSAAVKGVQGSIAQGVASRDGVRMMRGWAAPGKPAFQAEAEAALAAEESAKEPGSASDNADANAQNQPAATPAPSGAEDAANGSPESSAASSTANGKSVSETDQQPATAQESSSSSSDSSDEDSNGQPGVSKMIQNMTNLFAQRRQIQAQQNQSSQQQRSPSE